MSEVQRISIGSRFAASLTANILRSGIAFVAALLLARWLGPVDYGRMAFLLASFVAFKQLLDMASSSAFFTFLSQRRRSKRFVVFFWRWIAVQFLFSLLIVGLLLPDSVVEGVWKGEDRALILLALVATFMQQNVWAIASQMAEAQRETVRVQKLNTVMVLIHLLVVLGLWLIGKLVLPLLFIALIVEWSVAGWLAARMYDGYEQHDASDGPADTMQSFVKEFWVYCKPFIPYAWLGFAYDFADRWMLQHWGGASEQAYYAVAQQFSTVALMATTSILRIFWKEIAEAKHQGDDRKVERLYLKVSRGLYFVSALAAGGLLPWAAEIISLLLGSAYLAGTFTLMLMFLYPVHQSMGQIGGAMLFAIERAHLQVLVGMSVMATSIVVVYFMLAPKSMPIPGLGLASQGLALKMVLLQLVAVNVQAWLIARVFGWKFDWPYQLAGLGSAVLAGWVAKLCITVLISAHVLVQMLFAGVLYLLIMALTVYMMPWVAGFEREELKEFVRQMLGKAHLR